MLLATNGRTRAVQKYIARVFSPGSPKASGTHTPSYKLQGFSRHCHQRSDDRNLELSSAKGVTAILVLTSTFVTELTKSAGIQFASFLVSARLTKRFCRDLRDLNKKPPEGGFYFSKQRTTTVFKRLASLVEGS